MKSRFGFFCLAVYLLVCAILPAAYSQQGPGTQVDIEALKKTAPRVYIDCGYCDLEYIKTEITFVNYVRDRKEAQVHILITTQSTGSGGQEYTLAFSGQNEFVGIDDTVKYFSNQTDTADEIRKGLVKTLKLGLMTYVARTPISSRMAVSYEEEKKPETVIDKWNAWVFSVSGDSRFSGEKSHSYSSIYTNLSANRVTPEIKIRLGLSASYHRDFYQYEDNSTRSNQESYYFDGLFVKSLGEHWSVGGYLNLASSTYDNLSLSLSPAPAVEYNFFPYSQSTRRQLRVLYQVGLVNVRYREETIYFKMRETLLRQTLSAALSLKEKWGSISAQLSGSNYLHDIKKYSLNIFGVVQLNLFKGLNANILGGGSRIRDQLAIVKGAATLEEIILRRRQLQTGYNYFFMFGLSYTFGSIFTNVVNPRFGSLGSGGVSVVVN